jgi:diadenosine tetraphosphatase ApaH/serine/threonine PP2A family protein phosphatase
LGNHELAVVDRRYLSWFNPQARESLLKTITMLDRKSVAHIQTYPRYLVKAGCRFVHGFPPNSATLYLFQVREQRIAKVMTEMGETLCFVGHTHDLEIVSWDGHRLERAVLTEGRHKLVSNRRYIVNIGSVGQPRDGNNKAKYVIWDTDQQALDCCFVAYDIAATVEKILAAGLPSYHAHRLW